MFNLCLAEEAGGVGLGLAEAALVFEELGRALVPGPLVASHLAAGLVDGADDGSVVVGLVERPLPDAAVPAPSRSWSSTWPISTCCWCCPTRVSPRSTRPTLDASPLSRPDGPAHPGLVGPRPPARERRWPGRTSTAGGGGTGPC